MFFLQLKQSKMDNLKINIVLILYVVCIETITGNSPNIKDNADDCENYEYKIGTSPGLGLDKLQKEEKLPVLSGGAYKQCHVTSDGKYLVPDNVTVVLLKESDSSSSLTATIITSFEHIKDTIARGINIASGGWLNFFEISGTFSDEFEHLKSTTITQTSVIMRSELRYRFYKLLDNGMKLDRTFENRVREIVSGLLPMNNASDRARILAESLIRDYGTHYVVSTIAGALLYQEDRFDLSKLKKSKIDTDSYTIQACAGLDFLHSIGLTIKHNWSRTHEQKKTYEKIRMDTEIHAIGGPPFTAGHASKWVENLDNNLVTIDREGRLLSDVINEDHFPDLSPEVVAATSALVKAAIQRYYSLNTHKGCTNVNAENFDYQSNFDDGSCKYPLHNYGFAGIYQTCSGGGCSNHDSRKNTLTNDHSCPTHYIAVTLYNHKDEVCKKDCNIFGTGCHNNCHMRHIKAFWCAAANGTTIPPNTGYMFGGSYDEHNINLLTNSHSCPERFDKISFGKDRAVHVCVSSDYELGYRYSKSLGGFFTCLYGNPLVLLHNYSDHQDQFPKACPTGYTQHLMTQKSSCDIYYCLEQDALAPNQIPNIILPPFQKGNSSDVKPANDVTTPIDTTTKTPRKSNNVSTRQATIIATCVIGSTVVIAGLVLIAVYSWRKRGGLAYFRPRNYASL